jgi:hypothetical protein
MLRRMLRVCRGLLLGLGLGLGLSFLNLTGNRCGMRSTGYFGGLSPWAETDLPLKPVRRHVRNIRNIRKDGYDGLWKAGHEDWRGLCFALFLIC